MIPRWVFTKSIKQEDKMLRLYNVPRDGFKTIGRDELWKMIELIVMRNRLYPRHAGDIYQIPTRSHWREFCLRFELVICQVRETPEFCLPWATAEQEEDLELLRSIGKIRLEAEVHVPRLYLQELERQFMRRDLEGLGYDCLYEERSQWIS